VTRRADSHGPVFGPSSAIERSVLLRVSVVGTSGSGKTTLARRLAEILEVPCTELDALHWGPDWAVRPDFRSEVAAAVQQPAWVIDGNYGNDVRDLVWGRCTAILWLDFGFWTTFGRGVWRTFKRILTREELYAGNRESLRKALFDPEGVPLWIVRSYRRRKRETALLAARPEYAHATFIVLRSPADAARFLRSTGATLVRAG
jgi:adenylate kinase family enzyme